MSEVNRESLLQALTLVRPAIAAKAYVPILTHVCFDGDRVTAYNDVSAISVRTEFDYSGCLPGDLFIKALGKVNGENILLEKKEDSSLVITSGRSKIKLPTLTIDDFPYAPPTKDPSGKFTITSDILRGIELCLIGVGVDPTHPAQVGVTLDPEGGEATIYSTDNFTISRYRTSTKIKLPASSPIILPAFFCSQLIALASAFPGEPITVEIFPGALLANIGDMAELFTKMLVDVEPMDFARVISRYIEGIELDPVDIPDSFDSAIERALLILGTELDKTTRVTLSEGKMKLKSSSSNGEANDVMSCDHDDQEAFLVDPVLVSRALKITTRMQALEKVLVMASKDKSFLHLIAHCAG